MAVLISIVPKASIATGVSFFSPAFAVPQPPEGCLEHIVDHAFGCCDPPHMPSASGDIIEEYQGGLGWIPGVGIEATVQIVSINLQSRAGSIEQSVQKRMPETFLGSPVAWELKLKDVCQELMSKIVPDQITRALTPPRFGMRVGRFLATQHGIPAEVADLEGLQSGMIDNSQPAMRSRDGHEVNARLQTQANLLFFPCFSRIRGSGAVGPFWPPGSRAARCLPFGHEAKFGNNESALLSPTNEGTLAGSAPSEFLARVLRNALIALTILANGISVAGPVTSRQSTKVATRPNPFSGNHLTARGVFRKGDPKVSVEFQVRSLFPMMLNVQFHDIDRESVLGYDVTTREEVDQVTIFNSVDSAQNGVRWLVSLHEVVSDRFKFADVVADFFSCSG